MAKAGSSKGGIFTGSDHSEVNHNKTVERWREGTVGRPREYGTDDFA